VTNNVAQTFNFTEEFMGTLINTQTILTAAHIIPSSLNVNGSTIPVVPNTFYPTYESMFTVILGLHDITDTSTAQTISVSKITQVMSI